MAGSTRREFLGTAAAVSATVLASRERAGAATLVAAPDGVAPAGELAERIALTAARLTTTGLPAYSDSMILADVTLDARRRFFNFSGDVSGRYLEALSALPAPGRSAAELARLAGAITENQRADGRFGRAELAFTAQDTGNEQMALLWGNGRLLVGLMTYHRATNDAKALTAARRLADFLLAVRQATRAPEVMKRVEGQGAFGFICFTQLAEGLALLGRATGEARYLDAGREIVPLLPPRGVQHSHGYLTTLRGALMLHEAGGDPELLRHVERLWGELVASSDYIVDGSVLEYFGWGDAGNAAALDAAKAASGGSPRNEGCGLADLVRLTLQLHRLTGRLAYLEQAERCIVNAFAHNQFATGDFGSKVWFQDGFMPTPSVDRAWWCCTMHGYRAYRDMLDSAIVAEGDGARIDLFLDVDWRRVAELELRRRPGGLTLDVRRSLAGALRLRVPSWATATTVHVDGRLVPVREERGYAELGRGLATGSRIEVAFAQKIRLVLPDGRERGLDTLGAQPTRAALYCGPFLMGLDEALDPTFFSEPWPGNVIGLATNAVVMESRQGRLRLSARYEHDGFPGLLDTVLRPQGEKPADDQRTFAVWLNYRRA